MVYNPSHSQLKNEASGSPTGAREKDIQTFQFQYTRSKKFKYQPILIVLGTACFGFSLVIILLGGILFGLYKYYYTSNIISPGVNVLGTDIGSINSVEAAIILHKAWNLERRINLSDGINTITVMPGEIGIQVDPIATVKSAHAVGRTGKFLTDVNQIYTSYQNGFIVAPVVVFDPEIARSGLEKLTPQVSIPAKDASLEFDGSQLIEIPGELGYTINIDESVDGLGQDPYSKMLYSSAPIILKPVMPRINDIAEAVEQANTLLQSTATIYAYDPVMDESLQWQVGREDVGPWLVIDSGDNGPVARLDDNLASNYFNKINQQLGPERSLDSEKYSAQLVEAVENNGSISAVVDYNRTTYPVKKGDTLLKIGWKLGFPFWKILEANPDLDPDNVIAGTELVIPAKDELLPLPVVPNKRIIINISKQRLWAYENGELLGKYKISTGIDKSPTQPGIFQVQSHQKNAYASVWDLYMPNFIGIYEAWPGFMNGIHGLPTLSSGTRLWENVLGEPASFGCIILDLETSAWLYDWAEEGVIVEIEP